MEKIIDFIHMFGGKIEVLNFVSLVTFFFFVNSMINQRAARLIVSSITALIVILQLVSLYFTQTFIGYQFFVHFNTRGVTGMISLYIEPLILGFFLYALFVILFHWSAIFSDQLVHLTGKIFETKKKVRTRLIFNTAKLVAIGVFVIIMSFEGGVIAKSARLFSILNTETKELEAALGEIGMGDYISPNNLRSTTGKNIVVVSIESFEKGFLDQKLSHLSPNLTSLKEKWNYYEMEQNLGSDWTSGSLYTYFTGFPAFFGIHGNRIFQTAYHSGLSSIGHTLKRANYEMTYLIGNANHSGIKEMLYALQIRNIIDKYNFQAQTSGYGIRDKDLFERAKLEIRSKVTQNLHFALFLSTTDTHHPNGIYDSRMEKFVSPQKSDFEFMISAVDYMVGDFINFLERENILSNTVVYIFPDHLKMGDPAIFKGTGDRGLYLLTNSADKDLAIDTSRVLYQIDLPKIILNGAGVKHNQKFLTDYISGDKNEFIRNNLHEITAVNTAGFLRIGSEKYNIPPISDNYERYKIDTMRFIAHAGGMIEGNTYTNSLEALNFNYDKGFRLFELDILKTKDDEYVAAHDWDHWSEITNYEGELPVTHEEFIRHKILGKYTPLDMKRINDWFIDHVDATLVTDKINEPEEFSGKFIDKKRLMMELFDIETVKKGVSAQIKTSMPSQNVIDNLPGNKVTQLKQLGVNGIAISRTYISSNVEFLQELKENNIRVYAFDLNQAPGTDEDYVVKYEMDYIYGIYADKWDFLE